MYFPQYHFSEEPVATEINPFIDIEGERPLSSIELREYETRPFLLMQIICLIFSIFAFFTSYMILYFVLDLREKIDNAKFIQF